MSEANRRQPWKVLRSEEGPELPIFNVRYDWLENPRNSTALKAVVLDVPDWVTVAALTPENELVVVRQYRFGVGRFTSELPAGLVHAGEPHLAGAQRELQEETGYTSSDWIYLGWVEPNPAFQNNRLHQWLARDVRLTHPRQLDEGEDIEVAVLSPAEIRREIEEGTMRNSLALLSLTRIMALWHAVPEQAGFFDDFLRLDQDERHTARGSEGW
jgi:8-oxo-dGTP pyrophosphatase MutT (NUDIX family)